MHRDHSGIVHAARTGAHIVTVSVGFDAKHVSLLVAITQSPDWLDDDKGVVGQQEHMTNGRQGGAREHTVVHYSNIRDDAVIA